MPRPGRSLANFIGTKVLPFTNPRVVAPPGVPGRHGRRNIIVATPMRSGTHVLIDLLLNNIPAYRTRPLYVDLDQSRRQWRSGNAPVTGIATDAGHIVKTHFPIAPGPAGSEDIDQLLETSLVVTVRRDKDAILASLARWGRVDARAYERQFAQFWTFWESRDTLRLEFPWLFREAAMRPVLARICAETGTEAVADYIGPPAASQKKRIAINKTLTRLAGRNAPRIDTTIHTLK